MTKEQSSAAYIQGKLRDSNEYLGCEDNERKELIMCDLYTVQRAYEDGWEECEKQLSEKRTASESIARMAERYAWAEGCVTVNKATCKRSDYPIDGLVSISINDKIEAACKYAAKWMEKQLLDKAMEEEK